MYLRTMLDRNEPIAVRMIATTCIFVLVISVAYSIWRIQLASVEIRDLRAYIEKRDAEIWPIVREIRGNVNYYREFIGRADDFFKRHEDEPRK